VQLEVLDADGSYHMALAPGVTRAVGEDDLVVALAAPQQTQILRERERERERERTREKQSDR
jgi:predicted NAD/FAD-dependent oxidoreductase